MGGQTNEKTESQPGRSGLCYVMCVRAGQCTCVCVGKQRANGGRGDPARRRESGFQKTLQLEKEERKEERRCENGKSVSDKSEGEKERRDRDTDRQKRQMQGDEMAVLRFMRTRQVRDHPPFEGHRTALSLSLSLHSLILPATGK